MSQSDGQITKLLARAGQGDRQAQEDLFRRIETELKQVATNCLRDERARVSLQTTVLVDEVFMRLIVGSGDINWTDRAHFYYVAARAMRRLVVDHERQRKRQKRGGEDHARIDVDLTQLAAEDTPTLDLLALDEALEKLDSLDSRSVKVVELHHFGGHSLKETAKILGVSVATVKNDWAAARAFLHKELKGEDL